MKAQAGEVVDWLCNEAKVPLLEALQLANKILSEHKAATLADFESLGDATLKKAAGARVWGLITKGRGRGNKRPASKSGSQKAKRQALQGKSTKEPKPPEAPKQSAVAGGVVQINRSPVMILWAAVLAQRASFSWPEALSLGSAVAAMIAKAKGESIGIYNKEQGGGSTAAGEEKETVEILGHRIFTTRTGNGHVVGLSPQGKPVDAEGVQRSLIRAFGSEEGYGEAYAAMKLLAGTIPAGEDALGPVGYQLYTSFRPAVPPGKAGWGQSGRLDLNTIRKMSEDVRSNFAATTPTA